MFCGLCSLSIVACCLLCVVCPVCCFFFCMAYCVLYDLTCVCVVSVASCLLAFWLCCLVLLAIAVGRSCRLLFVVYLRFCESCQSVCCHHSSSSSTSTVFYTFIFSRGLTLRKGLHPHEAVRRVLLCWRHVQNIPKPSAIWPFFQLPFLVQEQPIYLPSESEWHIQKVACRCTPGLAKCHHGQTSIEDQVHGDNLT